ncbi:class I SAM-dependent methyltransferase [Shewanella cyperi]|uniref:Class I SAM-dependent methyltransferase n=1 Tax=Shewanella cyperi TaxID=2814292 RepID=A0A975AK62_9GAMM|nr:class I SAM-dependent methyltransferase [Shewanella cyperi]QSX29820.1 class I SAM-dependent methyltransferase [Shewanella cyperi]
MESEVADKYQITADTFSRLAERYQERFLEWPPYAQSYEWLLAEMAATDVRLLDVACGPGSLGLYLKRRRPELQITGTDLAPGMLALARGNIPDGEFLLLDSRDIGTLEGQFDLCCCGFGLPYLDGTDLERFIAGAHDKLRPGGLLYLSTMEGEPERSGWQTSSSGDRVFIHYHRGAELQALLEQQGFIVFKQFRQASTNGDTDLFIYARHNG